jgi:hypothetical protein
MFKWMASSYGGQTVSKVPFEAIFPFKYVVRGGLDEDNKSPFDSGYTLMFILSSQLIRCCMNRCMGVSLPSFAASSSGNWFDKFADEAKSKTK